MANKEYVVAVVGATGAVGSANAEVFRITAISCEGTQTAFFSAFSRKNASIPWRRSYSSRSNTGFICRCDIALFSAGGSVSQLLANEAVKRGAVVIDNTNAFRMTEGVPLVVPEVNKEAIATHQGIIANPNCSTIQMVVALKPLYDRYGIDRVIVSTYQSVSGAGWKAQDELKRQTEAVLARK